LAAILAASCDGWVAEAWYKSVLGARGGIWRGGERGSGDAAASWGKGVCTICGVLSPLRGMSVLTVSGTGKDGVLGDGEWGTYSSEGKREWDSL